MNQSSLFSTGNGLPEPNWQPIAKSSPGGAITPAIDREGKKLVMRQLGRKWTRRHDIAYLSFMAKNGHITAEALEQARQEYADERATKREHRREAGHAPNHGFRVW